jgi:hypothetical protein
MSRPKTLPHSPGVTPGEVWRVAAEQKPHELARRYNVRTQLMKDWLTGGEEMPVMLYELLAMRVKCVLPMTAGMFSGWTVLDGQRFTGPGIEHKGGLHWSDIDRIVEFRRASSLASRQADLIERLSKELAFYKRQCWLENRHGLLLRKMFDGPPKKLGGATDQAR